MVRRIPLTLFASLLALAVALLPRPIKASDTVLLAVAGSLHPLVESLRPQIEASTNVRLELIAGATGRLAQQIRNGAPYDLFLAADIAVSNQLAKEIKGKTGRILQELPFHAGSLQILIAKQFFRTGLSPFELLKSTELRRIGQPNPAYAPWGSAAEQWLRSMDGSGLLKQKMILGSSVAQVWQYLLSGNIDAAFVSSATARFANPEQFHAIELTGGYNAPMHSMLVLNQKQQSTATIIFNLIVKNLNIK